MSRILLYMTVATALTLGGQALAQTTAKAPASPPATGAVNSPAAMAAPPATAPAASAPAASTPAAAAPAASAPAPNANTSSSPASATVSAPLSSGLTVKDNTGAAIGQITELKADASGKQMATIKMATGAFSVAASSLVVDNGAAVINLTQQQIQAMIKKPGA
jgi:hypothetical protein